VAFFADLKTEVKKVDWPAPSRVWQITLVVFLIVALMTAFTFALDLILGALLFK
jgi:preprotein translocase SecE subunit